MRPLRRDPASILQLNIGLYCNQACSHCHVDSSPLRKEMMDRRTAERCLELLASSRDTVHTLDLTGGAPELNSQFRCCPTRCHLMMQKGLECLLARPAVHDQWQPRQLRGTRQCRMVALYAAAYQCVPSPLRAAGRCRHSRAAPQLLFNRASAG